MGATEIMRLIQQLAQELGPSYGITDVSDFTECLIAIASYESNLDPTVPGDDGHSIGLFQLHDAGRGAGMTVAQRSDPETNIRTAIGYLAPLYAEGEKVGQTRDQKLNTMIRRGQIPADPVLAFQRAWEFLSGAGGAGGAAAAGTEGAAAAQGAGGNPVVTWMMGKFGWSQEEAAEEFANNPVAWGKYYDDAMKTTTEGPAQWETPEYKEQQAAETTGQKLTNIETEAGLGLASYGISNEEYNRQRNFFADKVEAGKMTADNAVDKFNAWLSSTQEASKRAEFVTNIREERARRLSPNKYVEGTEPGGMWATLAARHNLPWTPFENVPVENMPSPEAAYEQYQTQMGISGQAPEIPTVNVPTAPTPPPGAQSAIDYINDLLKRKGIQMPQYGGA
jgi:hypothetical protein